MLRNRVVLLVAATLACSGLIVLSLAVCGFRGGVSILIINWMVLAWLATVTLVADLRLPPAYYEPRRFERTGRFYERLGIRVAKRLLRRGPLRVFSRTLELPRAASIDDLQYLESEMGKAETAHVLTFIAMLVVTGYAAVRRWTDTAAELLFLNLLINGYPIMLQRYNRIRLHRVMRARQVGATAGGRAAEQGGEADEAW